MTERKNSSLFFECVGRSLRMDSFGITPAKGGFDRITRYFLRKSSSVKPPSSERVLARLTLA